MRVLGIISSRSVHARDIGGIGIFLMHILEEDPGRIKRFDRLKDTLRLRSLGRSSVWSVHARGVGGIGFWWMQILKDDRGKIRGLAQLKVLYMQQCEALAKFPSGVCTIVALEELGFGGCKTLKKLLERLGCLTHLKIL